MDIVIFIGLKDCEHMKDIFDSKRKVWRKDFPWTERLVYFQHAFNSPLPRQVIEEVSEYFRQQSYLGYVQPDADVYVDGSREKIASLMNVKKDEITFTQSYTEGLNIVTSNIDWRGKDNIIVGEGDYFSTLVHFVYLAKLHDLEIRVIPMNSEGFLEENHITNLITENTAIVHLVHVPNGVGTVLNVKEVFNYAKDLGVWTILDASQSTGMVPHSIKELGCDFYSSVGKKWLMGPVGTAFLWSDSALIEEMEPVYYGKHFKHYDLNKVELVDTAEKFESTTLNQPGIIGLGASIDYLTKIGIKTVEKSIKEIISCLLDRLVVECDADIIGTREIENRTGITCFKVDWMEEKKINKILR
jgi:cysteine desulfurase/selenocysteine lyase